MNILKRRLTLAAAIGVVISAFAASAGAEDKDLLIFDWSGYEAPEFHPKYTEKHGDEPTFTFFGDEEEAFQKLRSGFKADLSHPCSQSVVKWRDAGLLQPLDTSKIAGWNDLNPGIMAMKNLATDDKGVTWFMPWEWGNTLLTYNSEKVDENDIKSLKAFADPKFEGARVDRRQRRRCLRAGLAGDRREGLDQDDGRTVQAGVGLPAPGPQERPALLGRHDRDRPGAVRRRGRSGLGLERRQPCRRRCRRADQDQAAIPTRAFPPGSAAMCC